MKRSLLYALMASLASATACQQEMVTPTPTPTPTSTATGSGIMAEWNWVSSVGSITGKQTLTPASTGTTIKWVFRADSTVQISTVSKGTAQPTQTVTYSLGVTRSIYSGQPARSLTLKHPQLEVYLLQALESQLVLKENHPDGFEVTFQRQ